MRNFPWEMVLSVALFVTLVPTIMLALHSRISDNPITKTYESWDANAAGYSSALNNTSQFPVVDESREPGHGLPDYRGRAYDREDETSTVVSVLFPLEGEDRNFLRGEYVVIFEDLQGEFRHIIPGANYRIRDAYLDLNSVGLAENRDPLRVPEPVVRRQQPLRLAVDTTQTDVVQ